MGIQDSHYSAFISYRHLDSSPEGQRWAEWVQKHIEGYETPRELVGQTSIYGDAVPAAMPRVFRDKDQLPAHGNLDALLHAALERSRVLIVLCSRAAAVSKWVDDEVRYFKSIGRSENIIALVIEGEPHSTDPAKECFPPALRHELRAADGLPDPNTQANPVYIDLRPPRGSMGATSPEEYHRLLQELDEYKDSVIELAVKKYTAQLEEARILLVSGVLGLSPVELTQRELLRKVEEQKQREIEAAERVRLARRRMKVAIAAASALLVVSSGAMGAMIWALKEKNRAEHATQIAEEERRKADEATRRAVEGEKAAQSARESIGSLLSANQAMSSWNGGLDQNSAEKVNESVCTYYAQHLPGDADERGLLEYGCALNRRGDLLFGSLEKPDSVLAPEEKVRRIEAVKVYRTALETNGRLVSRGPESLYYLANLEATYERVGHVGLVLAKDETLPLEIRKKHIHEAIDAYSKGLETAGKARAIDPDSDLALRGAAGATSWLAWASEVAARMEVTGSAENLHMMGEALKLYHTKRSLCEEFIEKAKSKPQWQASVAEWQASLEFSLKDIERVTAKPAGN